MPRKLSESTLGGDVAFVDIDHATRAELLELPSRYADALNTNRVEGFVGSFAPDGVWDVSSSNPKWLARGRDAIAKLYEYLRGAHEWVFQVVYQSVILECSGERAMVRTYVGEYGNIRGGGVQLFGVYNDECVKHEGQWYFSYRKFDALYHGPPDLLADPKRYPAPRKFGRSEVE